jgi:Trypsin-co-occurring domain 1
MNSKSVQVELPTGEVIWAQVAAEGPQNVASGGLQRLDVEDLGRTVRGVSKTLRQAVDEIVPDEVQVEFGLELALKSGKLVSMLAEAGATASIKVTLAWKGNTTAMPSPDAGKPAAEG